MVVEWKVEPRLHQGFVLVKFPESRPRLVVVVVQQVAHLGRVESMDVRDLQDLGSVAFPGRPQLRRAHLVREVARHVLAFDLVVLLGRRRRRRRSSPGNTRLKMDNNLIILIFVLSLSLLYCHFYGDPKFKAGNLRSITPSDLPETTVKRWWCLETRLHSRRVEVGTAVCIAVNLFEKYTESESTIRCLIPENLIA